MTEESGRRNGDGPVEGLIGGAPPPGNAGPCPEPNQLAALAQDRLLPGEREPLERHLALCAECRGAALLAREAGELRTPGRDTARAASPRRTLLAAAAVLLTAAAALWLSGRGGGAPTDRALAREAERLARARPELFASFEPLVRAERLARGPATLRAGRAPVPLHPAGRVVSRAPAFSWAPGTGERGYRVELQRLPEGATLWAAEVEAAELAYPGAADPLAEGGSYLWTVTPLRPGEGAEQAALDARSRGFEVAGAAETAAFEMALAEVRARADPALRELLAAHLALRRGFLRQAEEAARAHLARAPGDPVGLETLFAVLARLDHPEAGRLELPEEAAP